MDQGP
jgi:hypothetical protein